MTIYEDGESGLQKMISWANKGRGWANYDIGKSYSEGVDGLPLDHVKAHKHFKLASEQGFDKSMTDLGVCYIQGEGCKRDLHAARLWFEKASELDNAKAMCYLSYFLSNSEYGFTLDIQRAKKLILRSAELGFPQAQQKCGSYYWKGEAGFEVDLGKAIEYLTQAADQGEVDSMMGLAIVLMEKAEGEHGRLDIPGASPLPLAINWMRRGGKLGDDEAKRRANLTIEHMMKTKCANCDVLSVQPTKTVQLRHCAKCKVEMSD